MRLDKFLGDMGQGGRADLKKLIRAGNVLVNGEVVRDSGCQVQTADDVVLSGRRIPYHETEYFMMNKPAGVLTATEDKKQQTVLDLLTGIHRTDLFPVGRLDKDAEGLLLITNDGALAHRLLAPKSHVDKIYAVTVSGIPDERDCRAFERGIQIGEDILTEPAGLEIVSVSEGSGTSETRVTIHEGKFHQIKKMFAARGMEVLYLKRLAMGILVLDEPLQPGQFRSLTEEELEGLL